jgi:hypothetical protein
MRLPCTTVVRPEAAPAPIRVMTPGSSTVMVGGIQPSIDIPCILSKAAGCLPVCLSGNIPACIACAGPGILSCL